MAISVVGVDLSKSVFQLSVADARHHVIDRNRLSRTQFHRFLAQTTPVRLIMEACAWRVANSPKKSIVDNNPTTRRQPPPPSPSTTSPTSSTSFRRL
jgi:hypothetical protein